MGRLVLGASQDIRDYGLIINKVSKRVAKTLEDKDEVNNLLDLIFNDPKIPRTNNVHVVVFEAELNDEDDIYLEAKPELRQFIQGVKDSYVVGEEVEDLKIDEFEQLQAKAGAQQEQLLAQKKRNANEQKAADAAALAAIKKEKIEAERNAEAEKRAAEAKLAKETAKAKQAES